MIKRVLDLQEQSDPLMSQKPLVRLLSCGCETLSAQPQHLCQAKHIVHPRHKMMPSLSYPHIDDLLVNRPAKCLAWMSNVFEPRSVCSF
jgi:hypothetical protein